MSEPTSATATYSAAQVGGVYNYDVLLTNTSYSPYDPSYDLYGFMFGQQYQVPHTPFPLQDIVVISAPPGWMGYWGPSDDNIGWWTNWQGSSSASGYLAPGQTGVFRFQCSTAPPESIPFGCSFYNGRYWGSGANRIAVHRETDGESQDRIWSFAAINPLVLIVGDEIFARLNLPRPAPVERDLRARLAVDIQAMTARQRETAAEALDDYVAALKEVRAALKEPASPR
jgi:hypothetical protein